MTTTTTLVETELSFTRETPGTYRYDAPKGNAVTTFYVHKETVPGTTPPPVIRVTIAAVSK